MSASQSLLARGRARRAHTQNLPASETPRSSSPLPFNSSPGGPLTPMSPFLPPNLPATRPGQLLKFGEHILKRVKLSTEGVAEARAYCEITNRDERDVFEFIHLLELKDLLKNSVETQVTQWKPTAALLKIFRKYIWALLLLPATQYYAGTVEMTIIDAMRSSGTSGLPAADVVDNETLVREIARELSIARSQFKKAVTDSMQENNELDIATLTASLVSHSSHVNATLGLYFRVAFVRLHCTLGHSNAEFWPKVDQELSALRKAGSTEFISALEVNYEDDVEHYGDPITSKHKTGSGVDESSPKWLQTLNSLAPKIQQFTKRQGTKRKRSRVDSEVDEPADEPGNEDDQAVQQPDQDGEQLSGPMEDNVEG
ncbi:hypothetical protein DFH08DRAFT_939697 [Mycena albidolilacea]|uniref:Uncharacterized protein n=1 Tax=Mycena albidolilacea TaxID=1033008 RepID=A0AAD6ZQ71_9AGAR|nr:hypothetical protein DFH08DRAFT_939697 [Mycena albidolilacea]